MKFQFQFLANFYDCNIFKFCVFRRIFDTSTYFEIKTFSLDALLVNKY